MRERYAAVHGHTPQVLFGLSQSWKPLLHVMRHTSLVYSVAFSPDGSRLASGSDEIVRIWNTATGELEDELEGHTDTVWSVAFSHNGHFIVSGSYDTSVQIWNTATRDTRYMLTGHLSRVRSVAISSNDKFVVSGSYDTTVRIWSTAMGKLLHELKGHANEVMSVAVSPDGLHIASGSGNEVWIWTKDGVIAHKLECLSKYVYDLAFSHDGLQILCNVNRTEWTTTGHHLSLLDTNNDPDIISIAYSPNDNEIVCGLVDGTVKILNKDTNETHKLGRNTEAVNSISFSPNGSHIASGSGDGTVQIWDLRLRGTNDEEVDLETVTLSYDGRWIVTTSSSHIEVWRVTETVTKVNDLIVENHVECLALSRDGSHVVIGCMDGSIWVWNHLKNTTECQMDGHFRWVECVAFSYDGSYVVSGSRDNTVRIWDCHTGNEVGLYQHSALVTCVAFSCNSGHVAFGSNNCTVQIWDPSTGEIHTEPDSMSERRGWVHSIAFSCDGNHVISGWEDVGVRIWNVTTNEFTMLSERIRLPDGTRVHPLGKDDFHIYDPVDQETINGIPPNLLSISPDCDWITGEQGEYNCWIPPQYRNFIKAHIAKSIVCLESDSSMIVLDLKNTQHAERVMPGPEV